VPFVQKRIARHDHELCDDGVEAVFKAFDDTIDPAMLADIEALQQLYQNAMSGMGATVDRVRDALIRQGRGNDLRLFQETFAAQAIEDLRRSLGEVSLATEEQVMAEIQAAITRLPSGVAGVMRFNNKDPRAIQWAEQRAGAMIKQIEADTLQAVRGAISRVLSHSPNQPCATVEQPLCCNSYSPLSANDHASRSHARYPLQLAEYHHHPIKPLK